MTMTYTCTLTCGGCNAKLTFTDERPSWKTYDYRVEQADECERSARFVAEHVDDPLPEWNQRPVWHEAWVAVGRPSFIERYDFQDDPSGGTRRLVLTIPEPYRYVDCPVCDAQVREPKRA
jgi:hypothetical protein